MTLRTLFGIKDTEPRDNLVHLTIGEPVLRLPNIDDNKKAKASKQESRLPVMIARGDSLPVCGGQLGEH